MSLRPLVLIALLTLVAPQCGCDRRSTEGTASGETVVVYVAVDQYYAQPILEVFQRETGIAVAAVYDTEAAKTTGLVHRLITERHSPRADVFWNNEVAQTITLKQRGLLAQHVPDGAREVPPGFRDPDGYWTGVATRARVIVYNTERLPVENIPASIADLARPELASRVAVAYPLFGTTRTHAAAIFAHEGPDAAQDFFRGLVSNGVRFVDGNATVRDLVADGVALAGLTDSDDVYAGMLRGDPISMTIPDQSGDGTLLLPTTVAMLKNCPHPDAAKRLIDFIASDRVETLLAASEAAYLPLRPGVTGPPDLPAVADIKVLPISYDAIAEAMPAATDWLRANIPRGGARQP